MPCDPIWQPRAHWEILEVEEPAAKLRAFLEWRRTWATFRREVEAIPAGRSMADLLHLGAAGLSRLAVRAEPAGLPTGDRARLQGLRERIAAWLEDPSGAPDVGLLLRQELLDFAQLLSGVSQRPEVREHDRGLLERAYRELARARAGAQSLPPVVRVLLDGLFGLDDELDHLLERRRATPAELEPVLARIAAELAQPDEIVH